MHEDNAGSPMSVAETGMEQNVGYSILHVDIYIFRE